MESDSDESENVCPICERSFSSIAGVRVHWRSHTDDEINAAINTQSQIQPLTSSNATVVEVNASHNPSVSTEIPITTPVTSSIPSNNEGNSNQAPAPTSPNQFIMEMAESSSEIEVNNEQQPNQPNNNITEDLRSCLQCGRNGLKGARGLGQHTRFCTSPRPTQNTPSDHENSHQNNVRNSPNTPDDSQLLSHLQLLKLNVRVLKRIPKAARIIASKEFSLLVAACKEPGSTFDVWSKLLSFSYVAFKSPDKKDKSTSNLSIATMVKRNLAQWDKIKNLPFEKYFEEVLKSQTSRKLSRKKLDDDLIRIKKVQSKISEGDIRGAIRILSSTDTIAPTNLRSYSLLLEKHPKPQLNIDFADSPIPEIRPTIDSEIKKSIGNFHNGSSGGIDALRPQHLKDMVSADTGEQGKKLIELLSGFADMCLNGKVPTLITPILYGGSLCGFNKQDSIRPIAIGCTLRRMVSKIAVARVSERLGSELRPIQLGFGTPGGSEAATHSARQYINTKHQRFKVLVKLDFSNAFNELERDPMLMECFVKCPEMYPYIKQCYATASFLTFGDFVIKSERGCQQGDPCGPPLFCIGVQDMTESLAAEFNVWYLDDGTLGGEPNVVLEDIKTIIDKSKQIGIRLNPLKCEIFFIGEKTPEEKQVIFEQFNQVLPGITQKDNIIELLGAPLTDDGISQAIQSKISKLKLMVDRMENLNSHQAYFLLRHSLSIPQLTYLLRTTPCWHSMDDLHEYNLTLKRSMEKISNCRFDENAWQEATNSVRFGGLGLRNATNICFSSFLGSYHSISDLLPTILPPYIPPSSTLAEEALSHWQTITESDILPPPDRKFQHKWDNAICNKIQQTILANCNTDTGKARLLANNVKESGAWLNALPAASVGTLLDNQSFRISVSLRMGIPNCFPHTCICGEKVDQFGHHGLRCKKSSGRKYRHEMSNDLLKRGLTTGGVPSLREPNGCSRSDGKKPDGLTLTSWKNGKPLIWDFTCTDTLAKSYVKGSSKKAGDAALKRENAKKRKYECLSNDFYFIPVAIETMGPWGEAGLKLIRKIGQLMKEATGEKKSTCYLIQRISIAVQKGNAASIFGSIPWSAKLDEIYYIL